MTLKKTTTYYAVKTCICYVILFSIVFLCVRYFKSGPCTPNLDIASGLGATLICPAFLTRSTYLSFYERERTRIVSTIIHLVFCIAWFLYFFK